MNKWISNKNEADYIYGGETIQLSDMDIRKLRNGLFLNFSVNDEYGCVLEYSGTSASWIPVPNEVGTPWLKCSVCAYDYYPSFTRPIYKFCPQCGSSLRYDI